MPVINEVKVFIGNTPETGFIQVVNRKNLTGQMKWHIVFITKLNNSIDLNQGK